MSQRQAPKSPAAKLTKPARDDHPAPRLKRVGGSQSDDWNSRIVNDTIQTLWLTNSDDQTRKRQASAVLAGLVGIGANDELEGMMAAQLIAAHSAAMECYRRAMLGDQTFEGRHENLNQANKLSRSFAVLLDALNRHRGKGQQKVTVEHVHVHSGGQAVVGMVDAPGGGDRPKSQEQPDAKQIGYAPEPPLWGTDPERAPMPVASDAERPLPDARWAVSGSAKGE